VNRGAGIRHRRIMITAICLLVGMLCGGVGVVGYLWFDWTNPWQATGLQSGQSVTVRVLPGMTFSAAADTLTAKGLLRHPDIFRLGAKLSNQDRNLRAGLFRIPAGTAPRDLLDLLVSGPLVMLRVTLPEGIDAEQAAQIVAAELSVDPDRFLVIADSLVRATVRDLDLMNGAETFTDFDKMFAADSNMQTGERIRTLHWSEGYLAPDTYYFSEGLPIGEIAATMVGLQVSRLDSVYRSLAGDVARLGFTPHDLLTLASIVEAEARLDDERSLISAVYVNRLISNHRLEADPTVSFILEKRGKRLLYKDLEVNSPYNTYLNRGLPPGPIGTPGLLALQAAARPDSSCDAFFFVSDGSGGHIFSRTAAEHNKAVQRFRQERRAGRH